MSSHKSQTLGRRLRHLLKLPTSAIDDESAFTPTSPNRSESDYLKKLKGRLFPEPSYPLGGTNSDSEVVWTFHSAKTESETLKGYFHNTGHHLTVIDAGAMDVDFTEPLKHFQAMRRYDDEYTEIIAIRFETIQFPLDQASETGSSEKRADLNDWEYYFVDHFNRKFLTRQEFEKSLGDTRTDGTNTTTSLMERAYRNWMDLATSDDSHYYKPLPGNKKQCIGRKIAQQIVWDYQTTHVVKDADIEGSFSLSDCSSLLSALQKKRVSDKQCQKMIKAVIERFLRVNSVERPEIRQNFNAAKKTGGAGPLAACGMLLLFMAWTGPLLHVPFPYFRRLRLLAKRADNGDYVPDLWKTLIKGLLKEWTDLNIVLALILAANVSFLALPGTSGNLPDGRSQILADVSRAAGIISMFMTMSGLLTGLSLIWLHSPLCGTGASDAYRYIIGPAYKSADTTKPEDLEGHNSFSQLVWMASYLGMPLVLLLWSVIAFVVSAVSWIFLYSATTTQITTVAICGAVLISPVITLLVFRGPTTSGESLFSKMLRSQEVEW